MCTTYCAPLDGPIHRAIPRSWCCFYNSRLPGTYGNGNRSPSSSRHSRGIAGQSRWSREPGGTSRGIKRLGFSSPLRHRETEKVSRGGWVNFTWNIVRPLTHSSRPSIVENTIPPWIFQMLLLHLGRSTCNKDVKHLCTNGPTCHSSTHPPTRLRGPTCERQTCCKRRDSFFEAYFCDRPWRLLSDFLPGLLYFHLL